MKDMPGILIYVLKKIHFDFGWLRGIEVLVEVD
jgi:hypothetical protein